MTKKRFPALRRMYWRATWAIKYNAAVLMARRAMTKAPLAIDLKSQWFGQPSIGQKTAILACYSNGELPAHVLDLADFWSGQGYAVNIVAATDEPFEPSCRYPVLMRENGGLDFGSWAQAIDQMDLSRCAIVLLVNDSMVLGPKFPELVKQAEMSQHRVVGTVGSKQLRPHVQSFFMMFKRGSLKVDQWKRVKCYEPTKIVHFYELLAPLDHGIKPVLPAKGLLNPTISNWRSYTDYFIKRRLLRDNPYDDNLGDAPAYVCARHYY